MRKKKLFLIWNNQTQIDFIPGDYVPILYNQKKDGTLIVKWFECNEFLKTGMYVTKKQLKRMWKE